MEKNLNSKGISVPEEKTSIKATLIKFVAENYLKNMIFEIFDCFKFEKQLQEELEKYLNFEMRVFSCLQTEKEVGGQIIFEDEFGNKRAIHFSVLSDNLSSSFVNDFKN